MSEASDEEQTGKKKKQRAETNRHGESWRFRSPVFHLTRGNGGTGSEDVVQLLPYSQPASIHLYLLSDVPDINKHD